MSLGWDTICNYGVMMAQIDPMTSLTYQTLGKHYNYIESTHIVGTLLARLLSNPYSGDPAQSATVVSSEHPGPLT